jgi:hypothetical protein
MRQAALLIKLLRRYSQSFCKTCPHFSPQLANSRSVEKAPAGFPAQGTNEKPPANSETSTGPTSSVIGIINGCGGELQQTRTLAFSLFDWADVVRTAPIPLAFDLRTARHCQMVKQVRQGIFRTMARY